MSKTKQDSAPVMATSRQLPSGGEPKLKLRRAALGHKKTSLVDRLSLGAKSNLSTQSECDPFTSLDSIDLRNQQSVFSAGYHSTNSSKSRKRKREFLDLQNEHKESELVRFVLDTQGKLDSDSRGGMQDGQLSQCSAHEDTSSLLIDEQQQQALLQRSTSCLSSRSVHRSPSDKKDHFGLQKRRLIEDFQGLSLGRPRLQQRRQKSPKNDGKKKKLIIQVLNSVEFEDSADGASCNAVQKDSSLDCTKGQKKLSVDLDEDGGMSDTSSQAEERIAEDGDSACYACSLASQHFARHDVPTDEDWTLGKCHCKQYAAGQSKTVTSTKGSTSAGGTYLRLEIADDDIREQVNKQYYGNRNYFLDRMHIDDGPSMPTPQGSRSRSVNTPTANGAGDFYSAMRAEATSQFSPDTPSQINLENCCKHEVELRDRVLSSKRVLLRNFFSFYIKSVMIVNQNLNLSYLTKLKKEYMKLEESDKITLNELQAAVDEMEVDEQSKANLVEILTKQTNLRDLLQHADDQDTDMAVQANHIVREDGSQAGVETRSNGSKMPNQEEPSPCQATTYNEDIYMDVVE